MESEKRMREESGNFKSNDKITRFIYHLLIDYLTAGEIEELMGRVHGGEIVYTNGWLARYAENVAGRLKSLGV